MRVPSSTHQSKVSLSLAHNTVPKQAQPQYPFYIGNVNPLLALHFSALQFFTLSPSRKLGRVEQIPFLGALDCFPA